MSSLTSTVFSPHNDVLHATPSTPEEKFRLIEELKLRGKGSVTSRHYPDARDLYSKAIEVLASLLNSSPCTVNDTVTTDEGDYKKDLAILYSNRSLCNLKLNDASKSRDDATSATAYDPTYVKGYWRLGQACVALNSHVDAVLAYETAMELDDTNKVLKNECDKAREEAQKSEGHQRLETECVEEREGGENKGVTVMKDIGKEKTVIVENKVSSSSPTAAEDTNTEKTGKAETPIRGYKIVGGKKTSYFHHEQTEEEKHLIGDIAPKRISLPAASSSTTNNNALEAAATYTSAWNKAGTWEERDVTPWAIETLSEQVKKCTYTLPLSSPDPGAQIRIAKVSEVNPAHASVATVRGKKRYIYEFTICLHWEAVLCNDRVCTGNLTFPEVDGTHEIGGGYDIANYTVGEDTPVDCRYLLERFVRDGGLRDVLEKCLDDWVVHLRETY